MAKADMSQEPTMEEILASIRRIISEDDEGSKPAVPVMELTRPIEPDPEPVYEAEVAFDVPIDPDPPLRAREPDFPPAAPAPSAFDVDDEIEFADRHIPAAAQPALKPAPSPAPAAAPAPVLKQRLEPASEEEPLIGAPAAAMAADAFARLSKTIAIAETPNQTLEGMVRDMMKPLLRAWLDEHLPRIVEDKVEQEVARLARRMR